MVAEQTQILSAKQVEQKINRIAHEIYENHFEESELIVFGIAKRGYILADRIIKVLEAISPLKTQLIQLEINKHDPLKSEIDLSPIADKTKNKVVILVDDVLNSGKTLMYGTKPLLDLPIKQLVTVVLVNRRHRRYPIRADYVGMTLATTMQEHISVEIGNGQDAVFLT